MGALAEPYVTTGLSYPSDCYTRQVGFETGTAALERVAEGGGLSRRARQNMTFVGGCGFTLPSSDAAESRATRTADALAFAVSSIGRSQRTVTSVSASYTRRSQTCAGRPSNRREVMRLSHDWLTSLGKWTRIGGVRRRICTRVRGARVSNRGSAFCRRETPRVVTGEPPLS